MSRTATIGRKTGETDINVELNLDGQGRADIQTGVGFLDHMLMSFAKHGLMDLTVRCQGDLQTGSHHTIEDVGICLGQALGQALGDKRGIVRFATFTVPMDEALCMASVDISGRPYLAFVADLPPAYLLGNFEVETAEDFFRALCFAAGITLHVREIVGSNAHHVLEAMFKAVARALDGASQMDARVEGVPSTKGVL